ncbi:hypothetical protein EB001_06200 [bacterium]|nr:hypothetical protein [bacterium]
MENNDLDIKVKNWIDELNRDTIKNYPKDWTALKEVQLAHLYILNEELNKEHKAPIYSEDKGIVIGAGGAKFFGCAFNCAFILRKLGCSLPIEFWYIDEHEMDNKMKELCDIYNISYVNANQYCRDNNIKPRILNGWELKPFSTLHSKFKQVLYLDADNVPVKNPEYLFENIRYQELGSIFWPDLPPSKRKEWLPPEVWSNVGLDYRDEPDFETGQFLINKEKCYKELCITMWMNEHSDWFYKFVYGDKSTFHLAWRKCNSNYVMPNKLAGWKSPCILQYDLENRLVFQHACRGKEMIFSGTGLTNHYNYPYIKESYEARNEYWSGFIFSWNDMNENEKNIAKNLIGKYKYTRIGLDSRELELLDNGDIGSGKAGCERRWSIRLIDNIINIIVIGAAHKDSEIATFFAKDNGDSINFSGNWTVFEKCPITMQRL